jgi:hypothetical protein
MSQPTVSRSALERFLARVVRYWACNMTMVHDQGQNWPGFGYSEDEKSTLRAIARKVRSFEFFVWLALVAVFFIVIITGVMAITYYLSVALGVDPKPGTSEHVLYVQLCCELVVCLSVGFPLAMLVASWLVGRWFATADADLPDQSTTVHFFDKLVFQITRIAVICSLAALALWLFVPGDSKLWVLSRFVLPVLSPAVTALTAAYYFSARLRRSAPPALAGTAGTAVSGTPAAGPGASNTNP